MQLSAFLSSAYKRVNPYNAWLLLPVFTVIGIYDNRIDSSLINGWIVLGASSVILVLKGFGSTKLEQSYNYATTAILLFIAAILGILVSQITARSIFFLCIVAIPYILVLLVQQRWLSSRHLTVCIGIFFFAVCVADHTMPVNISYIYYDLLLPTFMATIMVICVNLVLPKHKIDAAPAQIDHHFLRRWVRIITAVLAIFIISPHFTRTHSFWAIYTILVITQYNLGATLHNSMRRIFGILISVVLSLAIYFIPTRGGEIYVIACLLTIISTCIKKNPVTKTTLSSLGLIIIHFMMLNHSTHQTIAYIYTKLVETIAGICTAFICELTIFPRAIHKDIRKSSHHYWQATSKYLDSLHNRGNLQLKYSQDIEEHLNKLNDLMDDYEFEPRVLLINHHSHLDHLIRSMTQLHHYIKNRSNLKTLRASDMQDIITITEKIGHQYNLSSTRKRYSYLRQISEDNETIFNNHQDLVAIQIIKKIISQYIDLLQDHEAKLKIW